MNKELEALTRMDDLYCAICPHKKGDCNECEYNQKSNIVYQALQEKQDLEKFTRLVVKKKVELMSLFLSSSAEQYNNQFVRDDNKLTEEEFTFIKEMIAKYGKRI